MKKLYTRHLRDRQFHKEDLELYFISSNISTKTTPKKESPYESTRGIFSSTVTALLPSFVKWGITVITKYLKDDIQKYVGEYQILKSNLQVSDQYIPHLTFERKVQFEARKDWHPALTITLKAKRIKDLAAFYYYVSSIDLQYAKAKVTDNNRSLDYLITIKPVFIVEGEKKLVALNPIAIHSIDFGKNDLPEDKYRTELIPYAANSYFSDAAIRIIESNPAQIRIEQLLEWVTVAKGDVIEATKKIVGGQ